MAETKSRYTTGFCSGGLCEGRKPKGFITGKPMKTCPLDSTACACKCHADLDKLFAMTGTTRVHQHNSEYEPDPLIEKISASVRECIMQASLKSKAATAQVVEVVKSALPDVLPPSIKPAFIPTPTGRAAPGQLEERVQKVTDMWAAMASLGAMKPCTPKWVSEMIDSENPPSTGAISAVFERWAEVGFATIEKKPTCFTGYTPEGIAKGLHALRVEHKSSKRNIEARRNRGEKV